MVFLVVVHDGSWSVTREYPFGFAAMTRQNVFEAAASLTPLCYVLIRPTNFGRGRCVNGSSDRTLPNRSAHVGVAKSTPHT